MHASAKYHGGLFFKYYVNDYKPTIVEIGSQNVNGGLRDVAPYQSKYIGLDITSGPGVDIVIPDPYTFPLDSDSVDVVVSSSCFEHIDLFWLTFLEGVRIIKPGGLFYINCPTNGAYHRYPIDSWRFYPDSGHSLVKWALRNNYQLTLLESFIGSAMNNECWNDYVAIFQKGPVDIKQYPIRLINKINGVVNGYIYNNKDIIAQSAMVMRQ